MMKTYAAGAITLAVQSGKTDTQEEYISVRDLRAVLATEAGFLCDSCKHSTSKASNHTGPHYADWRNSCYWPADDTERHRRISAASADHAASATDCVECFGDGRCPSVSHIVEGEAL